MKKETVEHNTIFLTIAGSKSYGTDNEHSDTDIRGICIIPDKTQYFGYGLNKFSQMDGGWEDDRVIYDLRKFIDLAAQNNPNILELLYVEPEFYLHRTDYYMKLWWHRDKFLSKKCKFTFLGYSFSQLKRIKSHRGFLLNPPKKKPERKDYGLPDKKLISADNLGAFQWLIAQFLRGTVEELNLSDQTKEELRNVNYIGIVQSDIPTNCYKEIKDLTGATDAWIESMMREKAYINAMNDWSAYQDWKNRRNIKRAEMEMKFGFDCKHAMHLVRLIRMGMEILEKGELNVYRPDREELTAIRNGAWSYEQVVEYAEKSEKKLNELYQTSTLRNQPDRPFLDNLCVELIEDYLRDKKEI